MAVGVVTVGVCTVAVSLVFVISGNAYVISPPDISEKEIEAVSEA